MGSKRVITNQQYENYWKLTLEYSDFYGPQFNTVLAIIVDYIDNFSDSLEGLSSEKYQELQNKIESVYKKSDSASTRKSINQMFKLGFIDNKAKSYHFLTKDFLAETDKEQKRSLYSRIVYDNASFSRSFSNESNANEIKFLVKTIEACGQISKQELLAIMFCDIEDYPNGYLTPQELAIKLAEITTDNTAERKYNQRNYLFNLCGSLTDIYTTDNAMSLNPGLIMDKQEKAHTGRDPYLQRLYKTELINEEKKVYKDNIEKCVLEHRGYPILIASHIKPYRDCGPKEQFDRNNGLLLSKNMDSLFDGGYITFDDDGNVITSSKLDSEVADYVKEFKLDSIIYNSQRKAYMQYHRDHVFLQ